MIKKQLILDKINQNIRNKTSKIIKSEHADVEEELLDAIFIPYQVIELDCTQQFIDDNFDLNPGSTMGLGKNLMVGFAMSNGNNGTRDRRKKTAVGYDPTAFVSGNDFSLIGNTFGEENHQLTIPELPAHDHNLTNLNEHNNNNTLNQPSFFDQGYTNKSKAKTDKNGSDQAHNNMQPSIVTLFIQRV